MYTDLAFSVKENGVFVVSKTNVYEQLGPPFESQLSQIQLRVVI